MRISVRNSRLFGRIFLFFLLVTSVACSFSRIPDSPGDIPPGSVVIRPPEVETWTLGNGLRVVYYQKNGIPITKGTLYLPNGSLSDDSGIPGLSSLVVQQMREGGTQRLSPDVLDDYLDRNAASIEGDQDTDATSFSFSGLSEDFDELLKVFSEVILTPAFDKSRLSLWKRLAEDEIRRRKDSPETIAALTYARVVYGENSPFYQPLSRESISRINEAVVRDMYSRLIVPEGATLIIVSDIGSDFIKVAIEERFSSWKTPIENRKPLKRFFDAAKSGQVTGVNSGNHIDAIFERMSSAEKPGVYVVESSFEQASVITGHRGPTLEQVNLYKQALFNRSLGSSGFGSLLFKEVRERRGLAYSIYGGFSNTITNGDFRIMAGTKADSSVSALKTIWQLLEDVQSESFPAELVEPARLALTKGFIFKYEDPSYAAHRPTTISLYGYPEDYDQRFVKAVEAVDQSELQEFAKQYLKPKGLFSVIVGNVKAEEIKKVLGDSVPVCKIHFNEIPKLGACL